MPSVIQPSPSATSNPSTSQKQPGIEQFLQQPAKASEVALQSQATAPETASSKTPKTSRKKMTAKEMADAEVLDRRNKKKSKDISVEARAARKAARQAKRDKKLANRRGVTGDGSDRKTVDGDTPMSKAIVEVPDQQNPLLVPLPADGSNPMQTEDQQELQAQAEDSQQSQPNPTQQVNQNYGAAAAAGAEIDDDDTEVNRNRSYQVRRVRMTLVIKKPSDKEQRLQLLQEKANEILRLGRKHESDLYLRKFDSTESSEPIENRRQWLNKFKSSDCSMQKFKDYFAGGLENYHPLSKEKFYFRVSLVTPHSCCMESLISEMDAVMPGDCKISNLLSQKIWDPKKIGSLFRSPEKLASTGEFLDELNRRAALIKPHVVFGLSISELRHPNIAPAKDFKSANKAISLETNANILEDATLVALKLFPAKRPAGFKPIWGMNLMFMFDVTHPAVANLDTALVNIATLISRNKRFRELESKCTNSWILPGVLDDPVYEAKPTTLRDILMSITSKTTEGCEGGQLFQSVCYSKYKNRSEYWFTYHKQARKEAEAVVRALPTMLRIEYNITPEHFFFEGGIDPSEDWNAETRRLHNQVTSATDMMLEETADLQHEEEEDDLNLPAVNEDDNVDLTSIDERERDRQMGKDDEETLLDQTKKKPIVKPKTTGTIVAIPTTVAATTSDAPSVGASSVGMGSVAGHSKTRQAQQEVLEETNVMIQQNNQKLEAKLNSAQKLNAKKDKKIKKMEKQIAMILARVNLSNTGDDDSDEEDDMDEDEGDGNNTSSQGSGQNSGEHRNQQDGSIFVPNLGNGDPDDNSSGASNSKNPEEFLDVEKEVDKFPSDISNPDPYVSTDEEHNSADEDEDEDYQSDMDDVDSVGNSSSSSDPSSEESSSSTSAPTEQLLPVIPSHKSIAKPKKLETKFNKAAASTGGDPGPTS